MFVILVIEMKQSITLNHYVHIIMSFQCTFLYFTLLLQLLQTHNFIYQLVFALHCSMLKNFHELPTYEEGNGFKYYERKIIASLMIIPSPHTIDIVSVLLSNLVCLVSL